MVAQHCLIHPLPSSTDEVRRRPRLGAFLESGRPTRADLRSDQSRASTQGYYFDHEKDCVDDGGGNNKHDDGSEFNLDDLIEPDEEAEECNQKLKQQQKQQIQQQSQQSTMVASSTQSPISSPESSFGSSIGSDTAGQPRSGWTKAQQTRLSRRASGNVFETMMHRSMPAGRLLSLDDSIRSCASIEYSDDGPRARRPSIVAVSEYSDDGPRTRRRTRRRNQISGMSSMAADNMYKSLPDLGDLISDVLSTSDQSLLDDEGENADFSNPIDSMFASFDEKRLIKRRASTISCTNNNNRGNRRRAPIGTREILQRAKSERILPVASHSLPSGADRDRKSGAPKNGVVSNLPSTTKPEGGRRNLLLRSQSERLERRRMKQPREQDFTTSTSLHLSLSSIGSRPEQQTPILPTYPPPSASNLSRGGRRVPQRSQSDQLRPVVKRSSMGTITEEGGRTTMNAPRRSNNTSHRSDNVSCALLPPRGSSSGRGRSVPSIRTGVQRSSSLGSHSNNNHSRSNVADVKFVRNQRHKDPNGQDGRYTGIISNFTGAPNGDGRLDFANGGYYEGEFFHGVRTGTGKLLNKLNGDYYSGDFMDDKIHGVGSMIFCDGSIYKGKFVLGYITEGVMVYPNGASYTGKFRNGKRHCVNGIYVYQDGSIYIGNFENDVVAGHGQMTWKDGSHYVGGWKDGKQDGFGKEFRPDGTICQEGLWHGGDIVA